MPYTPKPRRSALRSLPRTTLLLWVVLIVAFSSIWLLLREPSQTASHAHTCSRCAGELTVPALSLGVFVLVMVGALWFRRLLLRANKESAVALKLFNSAEYAAAASGFVEMLRKYPRPRAVRATTSFNLAMALMRNGELDRTLETLAEIDPWLPRYVPALAPSVAVVFAMVHALRGDPAAANRWIAEATARAKRVAPPRPLAEGIAFVQAVNALRRDETEEAAHILDAAWADLEASLVAVNLRPYRALRAFAAARGGSFGRPGRDSDAAALTEARPGELAWLGVEWPEMRAFLEGGAADPRALH